MALRNPGTRSARVSDPAETPDRWSPCDLGESTSILTVLACNMRAPCTHVCERPTGACQMSAVSLFGCGPRPPWAGSPAVSGRRRLIVVFARWFLRIARSAERQVLFMGSLSRRRAQSMPDDAKQPFPSANRLPTVCRPSLRDLVTPYEVCHTLRGGEPPAISRHQYVRGCRAGNSA
jgi:hypothetical protein